MKHYSATIETWLLAFVVCVAAVALSFLHADIPIARYCSQFAGPLNGLSRGLGSAVLLSGEAIVVVAFVLARLTWGKLPPFAAALALACLTSICAFGIVSNVLKVIFGVPNPIEVLSGSVHTINLWQGSANSSFPSGHMILAAAFGGVFMRLYRVSIWPLSILLVIGCTILVVGEWHFLSDVIAGTFLGVSAGLLAGELWEVHSENVGNLRSMH